MWRSVDDVDHVNVKSVDMWKMWKMCRHVENVEMCMKSVECCVNVEVSALLEHWLGWDHHHHSDQSELVSDSASPMPTSWADRLVSHLVEEAPIPTDKNSTDHPISIWVRKFCSEIGCDVLKKQDNNGKTLLHHLLSGK